MDNERDPMRYWIDPYHVIVRRWTDEEYETHDPNEPIMEELWCNICPFCSCLIDTAPDQEWAKRHVRVCSECSMKYTRKRQNEGYARIKVKLRCFEIGYKYIPELDKRVLYQSLY